MLRRINRLTIFLLLVFCNTASADIYKWVDENGRVHFGDSKHKPEGKQSKNLSQQYAQPGLNFTVSVIPVNYDLPLDTKTKIITAVTKIFYVLSEYNNIPFPDETNIKVKVFGSQREFIRYQKKSSSGSVSRTGYFSLKNNEAVVWRNRDARTMLKVISHEAFHTIVWKHYKHTPTWLNEGLAEYFEQINVFGSTAVIPPNKSWDLTVKAALRQDAAPPMPIFVDMDRKQWNKLNDDEILGYAMGWSVSYFLMSSKHGRQLIVDIFNARKENKQALIHEVIEQHYPGGNTQLQTDWENWVFGKKTSHRY